MNNRTTKQMNLNIEREGKCLTLWDAIPSMETMNPTPQASFSSLTLKKDLMPFAVFEAIFLLLNMRLNF